MSQAEDKMLEIMERHLPYEITMLVCSHTALGTMIYSKDDHSKLVRNSLINSFCIAARNVLDFLLNKINARASAVTFNYKPFAQGKPEQSLIQKIQDQIAHITLNRTSDPEKKINGVVRDALSRAIIPELIVFRGCLRKKYQHTPWDFEVDEDGNYRLLRWPLEN